MKTFNNSPKASILIAGVYLDDKLNYFQHIAEEFKKSSHWNVIQRWAAIGLTESPFVADETTCLNTMDLVPKFILINRLLAIDNWDDFEFIIIADDDIQLQANFLDEYLELTMRFDLSLAQPARTWDSYTDHFIVNKINGIYGRQTRFVEIGPLFSIRKNLFATLLPFDESSPMGWGYDLVWPLLVEKQKVKMGIVDATPVSHNLRKPVSNYDFSRTVSEMELYLSKHPHLSFDEAFTILTSFA